MAEVVGVKTLLSAALRPLCVLLRAICSLPETGQSGLRFTLLATLYVDVGGCNLTGHYAKPCLCIVSHVGYTALCSTSILGAFPR